MFSYSVIGAGLAGLAFAEALHKRGVPAEQILLVEEAQPAAGSSGAIGAMLNPLPGRSLIMKAGHAEAYAYAYHWILQHAQEDGRAYCRTLPILRPFVEDLGAEQMQQSFLRGLSTYPATLHSENLSASEVAERFPWLTETDGALLFSPALAVHYGDLTRGLFEKLQAKGIRTQVGHALHTMQYTQDNTWCLRLADGTEQITKHVIFSIGADLDLWFPDLPLQTTGGELAEFRPPAGIEINTMLSAAGYLIPNTTGNWIAGATFWHGKKASTSTQEEIFSSLRAKIARMLPAIEDAEPLRSWFGVRAIHPADRLPFVGPLPELPNVSMLGAFSSKGLLWGPWSAACLAAWLVDGENAIHPRTHTQRIPASAWKPSTTRILGAP